MASAPVTHAADRQLGGDRAVGEVWRSDHQRAAPAQLPAGDIRNRESDSCWLHRRKLRANLELFASKSAEARATRKVATPPVPVSAMPARQELSAPPYPAARAAIPSPGFAATTSRAAADARAPPARSSGRRSDRFATGRSCVPRQSYRELAVLA